MKKSPASAPVHLSRSTTARRPAAATPFHAFIAYSDVPAARNAMRAINEVLRAAPQPFALQPMLWRFDQLGDEKWQAPSLVGASTAQIIVLASSVATELTAGLERWLAHLLACKRGSRATIVALLGESEAWTISIDVPHVSAERAVTAPFAEAREMITSRAA